MNRPTTSKRTGFLRQIVSGRQEPDAGMIIDSLMIEIIKAQFSVLIELNLTENHTQQEDRAALTDSLTLDFKSWLMQNMGKLAKKPVNTASEVVALVDAKLRANKIRSFVEEANDIFLGSGKTPTVAVLSFPSEIGLLVSAVQNTALSLPMRLYRGKNQASPQVVQALHEILQRMEEIRTSFSLDVPAEISRTTDLLQRELAQAGEYVWLPLKPLVTSPLEDNELDLYARERDSVARLAYQILKGNGVILITGYRGVGKSTFVNDTLMRQIAEAEKQQTGEMRWKVVPIQINIAKAASVDGVLRLCIRAIYRKFRQLDGNSINILAEDEKTHIGFANLRASYKVNLLQGEALSKSKSLQMAFGFKPGDLLTAPLKLASVGLLPDLGYNSSKVWNETLDRTISLLDYDEERAEEDIVQFISMLSRPRDFEGAQVMIKLVFVFDELDKMEAEKGQEAVIRQLKNLFLTRHAVFVLVTSKEFYYVLLNDRRKEDSILGSYFSSVITVPMFTAKDTANLLRNLLLDVPKPDANAQELISRLAHYLTFQARGLPREIVRELRGMQQWVESTLQPYLSDRTISPNTILLYKALEEIVENLDASQGAETPGASQDNLNKERIWLNEGRKEQIRRGCYILLEELVNQGLMEFEVKHIPLDKDGEAYNLYAGNFTTISYVDFIKIYSELGGKLAAIRLDEYPEQAFFTYKRERSEAGESVVISVENLFYNVTGFQIKKSERVPSAEPLTDLTTEQIIEQASDLLTQGGLFATRRALNYLENIPTQNIPTEVQDKLFDIFLTFSDLSYRLEAGGHISPRHFHKILQNHYPAGFLATEANEQVLKAFVALTIAGVEKKKNPEMAVQVIRDLLNRNFEKKNPLSNAFFQYLITEIQQFIPGDKFPSDARNVALLEQILTTLNRFEPIPDSILPALIALANVNQVNLPVLLLEKRFYSLKSETLTRIFAVMPQAQALETWTRARSLLRETTASRTALPLGRQMAIGAMQRLVQLMPETMEAVEAWLSSKDWSLVDEEILQELNKANPKLPYELESFFKLNPSGTANQKIQALIQPVSTRTNQQPPPTVSESSAPPAVVEKPKPYTNPNWLNFLVALPFALFSLLVPIEGPDGLAVTQIMLGNILKALSVVGGAMAVGSLLIALFTSLLTKERLMIWVYGVLGGVLALISGGLVWLLISWGYAITLTGFGYPLLIMSGFGLFTLAILGVIQTLIRLLIWSVKKIFRNNDKQPKVVNIATK